MEALTSLVRRPGVVRHLFKNSYFVQNQLLLRSLSSCRTKMPKTALLVIAEGSEEMEVVITVDCLRRAGITTTIAGLSGKGPVKCSREVVLCPDMSLDDALKKGNYDAVILPGGMPGTKALAASAQVGSLVQKQEKEGRVVAAICAAPTALKEHGVGLGKNVTSYPSTKPQMLEGGKYKYKDDKVVVDGNLITSQGPSTAFDFALAIVEKLLGKEAAEPVAKALLLKA